MSDENEGEFGLVMPFVSCQPNGPHDPTSYVQGWDISNLDFVLEMLSFLKKYSLVEATVSRYVAPESVPQIDLVAMRHGFTMTTVPWDEHPDEWVLVTLQLSTTTEGEMK